LIPFLLVFSSQGLRVYCGSFLNDTLTVDNALALFETAPSIVGDPKWCAFSLAGFACCQKCFFYWVRLLPIITAVCFCAWRGVAWLCLRCCCGCAFSV
jgi:hypothetical protein